MNSFSTMDGQQMIETQKVIMLDVKLYDSDIANFISIIEKLLMLSSKPGFVKQFTVQERGCIENIAQSIGLDIPEQFHVNANIDTVKI